MYVGRTLVLGYIIAAMMFYNEEAIILLGDVKGRLPNQPLAMPRTMRAHTQNLLDGMSGRFDSAVLKTSVSLLINNLHFLGWKKDSES